MPTPSTLAAVSLAVALTVSGCGSGTTGDSGVTSVTASQATEGVQSSEAAPELNATSMPPWPAPVADVPARVTAAGLELGPMGMAEHFHPRLRILVNGTEVPVPPNIGVDPTTGAMSAVHTHEGDGTIHIEAASMGDEFTLGQLFTEWGVRLSSTRIGGASADAGQRLKVLSNRTVVTGDPSDLRLAPEQQIVLQLG